MAYMYSNECGVCDRRFGSVNSPATVCPECHNSMVPYTEKLESRLEKIHHSLVTGRFIEAHSMVADLRVYVSNKFAQKQKVGRDCYKIGGKWDKMKQKISTLGGSDGEVNRTEVSE